MANVSSVLVVGNVIVHELQSLTAPFISHHFLLNRRFFYFFYWMINAGAFCGQLLTAQLRASVQCFGGDCFLLPFAILVCVMVVSTAIFYSGNNCNDIHHSSESR